MGSDGPEREEYAARAERTVPAERTVYTGRGDVARTMELLWGTRERGGRGPTPGLSVERIVAAGTAIADAEGLDALSMRRVAERLGVGTMSLYRHVPSKAELLDVMVDRAMAEVVGPDDGAAPTADDRGWRARLERVAHVNHRLYERHPWLLSVFLGRPPLGPGVVAKYDAELRTLEGIGLSDVEMDSTLTLVLEFVRGSAVTAADTARVGQRTGLSDDEWWAAVGPLMLRVYDADRHDVAARVGAAASECYGGLYAPDHAFAFGLERLLDGIAVFVERRRGGEEGGSP